jgi:S-formylglutathione hydrolase FrmB
VPLFAIDDDLTNGPRLVKITTSAEGNLSFTAQLRVSDNEQPSVAIFDFGTASSVVGVGYQGVSERSTYSPAAGYGWTSGQIYSLDRTGGSAVLRDFNYTSNGTFVVDLPDDLYVIDLILGDTGSAAHDHMGIELEGRLLDSVSTLAGNVVARSFTVQVTGGQLSLQLRDLGGQDSSVPIQALRIHPASMNPSGAAWWPAMSTIPGALFSEATRDASGLIYYSIYSPYQRTTNTVRVLLPSNYSPERVYPVIYVLPVEAGMGQQYGDGLSTIRSLGLDRTKNAIFVAPTFSNLPWYVDNSRDSSIWQETYFKNVVVPFVESQFAVTPGPDGRLLLGFSKSGYGAVSMLLRSPDYFGKAVAWDAPVNMRDANSLPGFADILGDPSNYARNYQISSLLVRNGAALRNQPPRVFLLGYSYSFTREDLKNVANLMSSLKIPVVYQPGTYRQHHWNSGWVAEAVNMLTA